MRAPTSWVANAPAKCQPSDVAAWCHHPMWLVSVAPFRFGSETCTGTLSGGPDAAGARPSSNSSWISNARGLLSPHQPTVTMHSLLLKQLVSVRPLSQHVGNFTGTPFRWLCWGLKLPSVGIISPVEGLPPDQHPEMSTRCLLAKCLMTVAEMGWG